MSYPGNETSPLSQMLVLAPSWYEPAGLHIDVTQDVCISRSERKERGRGGGGGGGGGCADTSGIDNAAFDD